MSIALHMWDREEEIAQDHILFHLIILFSELKWPTTETFKVFTNDAISVAHTLLSKFAEDSIVSLFVMYG